MGRRHSWRPPPPYCCTRHPAAASVGKDTGPRPRPAQCHQWSAQSSAFPPHRRWPASPLRGWDLRPTVPARPTDKAVRRCWSSRRNTRFLRSRARARYRTPAALPYFRLPPCGPHAGNSGHPAHCPPRSAHWPAGPNPTRRTLLLECCRPMPSHRPAKDNRASRSAHTGCAPRFWQRPGSAAR